MTTDTALRVVKKIIECGTSFENLNFIDRPEIRAHDKERLILNFRFLSDHDGSPIIAPGIKDLLMQDDGFEYDLLE